MTYLIENINRTIDIYQQKVSVLKKRYSFEHFQKLFLKLLYFKLLEKISLKFRLSLPAVEIVAQARKTVLVICRFLSTAQVYISF